jgi:hypothetical protein
MPPTIEVAEAAAAAPAPAGPVVVVVVAAVALLGLRSEVDALVKRTSVVGAEGNVAADGIASEPSSRG